MPTQDTGRKLEDPEMRVSLRSLLSAGTLAALLSVLSAVAAFAGDAGGPFPR